MTGNQPSAAQPEPQPGQAHQPEQTHQPDQTHQPGYPQPNPYASPYSQGYEPPYTRPQDQPPPGYEYEQQPGYQTYPGYPGYQSYPGYPGYTVYPYPAPYAVQPASDGPRTQAIAALVSNIAVCLLCCPLFGIAGIVLSAVAMSRSERDPVSTRKLVTWSWAALAASIVTALTALVLVVAFAPPDY